MDSMKHVAELAKRGHGQIVAAVAEPGVGKSRLFFEFKAISQSGWLVLEAFSVSHGKATAYLPLIDLVHSYFKISDEDDPRARRAKVTGNVLTLDRALEATLPYLFALLGIVEGIDPLAGMDDQTRRRRTQEAVKRVLLRESLNQPLMLIFEDLHWIDDETQGFLNLLAEGVANTSLLLLVNYRPEYTHQWNSKTYYTQLPLDPLGTESAAEMLTARVGDSPDLAPLKQLVLERTEGNPLFIEELVEALFDEGVLARNGAVKMIRPLTQIKIPPTVQGILAARIDRLPPDSKELLQTLAVIGSEFPLALVRQVVQLPDERLDRLLDVLQTGEFIYEQPAVGDVVYIFKHALTHDEADKSLLTERRKLLHGRTAQAIETLFAQSIDDHASELAHHYSLSANNRKAVEFLGHAGKRAAERSAFAEARGHISNALQLVKDQPDDLERARIELDLEATLNQVVLAITGSTASAEVEQGCMRVRRLSERVGERSGLLHAIWSLSLCYMVRGELAKAKTCAYEGLALATQDGAPLHLIGAHFQLAQTFLHMGEFADAVKHCRDVEAILSMLPDLGRGRRPADTALVTNFVLAQSLCCLGFPDQARQIERKARSEAQNATSSYLRAAAMAADAELLLVLGDARGSLEQTDAGMSYAAEKGVMSQWTRMVPIRGWALVKTGNIEEGIAMLRETNVRSEGWLEYVPTSCSLAEAYHATGRPHEGLEMLRRAQDVMDRTGDRHWAADLFRLKGELLLLDTPLAIDEAEASLRQAIEVARRQSAKWWELGATMSLARLLRDTNRRDEACAMLAEIYNWFTEGFDTADLKDAKALLNELSN
jgi:tetratricopeptide (TPR) repeat protein